MDINDLNSKMTEAIENEDDILILELVKQGADINFIDNYLDYSVLKAMMLYTRNTEYLDFLIEKGADIYGKNNKNNTGLHISSMCVEVEIIEYFLDLGIDVNSKNDDGNLPIDEVWYADHFTDPVIKAFKLLIERGSTIYEENGDLLEWIPESFEIGFNIINYYNKHSPYMGSIKPAKR
jgi:ankyrin repeat protein